MPPGVLYLLPSALGDEVAWQWYLPQQAREIALSLEYFIVENEKSARAELTRLGAERPLRDLHMRRLQQDAKGEDLDSMLQPLLQGHSAAIMSEAGCPGVADPGAALVRRAHEMGIPVSPLVGPSSVLLALMASGMNGQRFAFHGYLPVRDPARRIALETLERDSQRECRTQIFIETPYRNEALLSALLQCCRPSTLLCLGTDFTLASQSIVTHPVSTWRRLPRPVIKKRPTVFLLLAQ
jgi:16S rRNA (cytidine1402-2'-O)-methyltransferase